MHTNAVLRAEGSRGRTTGPAGASPAAMGVPGQEWRLGAPLRSAGSRGLLSGATSRLEEAVR